MSPDQYLQVAIPSFIQGISTLLNPSKFPSGAMSQSLLLFRAFQRRGGRRMTFREWVAIPSFIQGISTLRLEILDR